jgi:hypothetical protein
MGPVPVGVDLGRDQGLFVMKRGGAREHVPDLMLTTTEPHCLRTARISSLTPSGDTERSHRPSVGLGFGLAEP